MATGCVRATCVGVAPTIVGVALVDVVTRMVINVQRVAGTTGAAVATVAVGARLAASAVVGGTLVDVITRMAIGIQGIARVTVA